MSFEHTHTQKRDKEIIKTSTKETSIHNKITKKHIKCMQKPEACFLQQEKRKKPEYKRKTGFVLHLWMDILLLFKWKRRAFVDSATSSSATTTSTWNSIGGHLNLYKNEQYHEYFMGWGSQKTFICTISFLSLPEKGVKEEEANSDWQWVSYNNQMYEERCVSLSFWKKSVWKWFEFGTNGKWVNDKQR